MGNVLLLLFSLLLLCLALLYFKRKWPDLDVIDIYLIFIALYFGVYPFIRGLYFGKGVVFDSSNNNPWAISLVYLQIILITIIIRVASLYLPENIRNYLKVKTWVAQWARIDKVVVLSLFSLLILFQFISYFKYGVKSHIRSDEFAKMGKDLPYWLTSIRTIYNYLTLSVVIVLAAKASLSKYRTRYFWLALIIIFLPFVAYFGRKAFVNAVVMAALIWLVNNEKRLFRLKSLTIAALLILSFFIASNIYQTYRPGLQGVVSFRQLQTPIIAALNFDATLRNFRERGGTWEFNYLVLDRQMREPGKVTTNGKITIESIKSATPRILWPGKKFQIPTEVLADEYHAKLEDFNLGSNIFGIAQSDFGYFSMLIVPLTILLIMIVMAGLMKMTFNYPVFFWLLSVNILNFLINIEENGPEIFFMLRNSIAMIVVFLLFFISKKIISSLSTKRYAT